VDQAKPKYIISNVVYGDLYCKIFLEQHLRSVLDETNLPAITGILDVEYCIYTDAETKQKIMAHANFKRLLMTCAVRIADLDWKGIEKEKQFDKRYSVLMQVCKDTIAYAIDNGFKYCTAWVADLVVARNFFPKIVDKCMAKDHGAVFVLPLRSAFERVAPILNQENRALDAKILFNIGYSNLHPLWTACEWDNRRFTKLPFCVLWSSPTGILVRSFSLTPVIFEPAQKMLEGRGMIDGEIPHLCRNPYLCTDWTDAPVMGVEPLFCYYPTFNNRPSHFGTFKRWTRQCLHWSQIPFFKKRLYYPDRETAKIGFFQRMQSDKIARKIQ